MRILALVLGLLPTASPQSAPQPPPPAPVPAPRRTTRLDTAAKRNENVAVYQIDNYGLKEASVRLGDQVTLAGEANPESSYFASEHGKAPTEIVPLRKISPVAGLHLELFEQHQNAVLNARTFFQVGPVQPSHRNIYGARATAATKLGYLTMSFNQRKIRGMVNGNVLVPLRAERTPLATDPRARALIASWLAGYPNQLPNRPDHDARALNTNAPQSINDIDGTLRLDRDLGSNSRLTASHTLIRQNTKAFELVAGQNPDTEVHSHQSRLTLRHAFSPASEIAVSMAFLRTRTALYPEPHAVGPRVRLGFAWEELGPDSQFPIARAQNVFRYGVAGSRLIGGGRHSLSYGGDWSRTQVNGIESNNGRGYWVFSSNFGKSAIENFLLGQPSVYEVAVGELSRGFRNSNGALFLADKFKVNSRLQVYYGLRYSFDTAPREVNGRTPIPYHCDCNNFSPRFSMTAKGPADWVMRASYNLSFAQIQPVSYQQARINDPVKYMVIQNPPLLDPLRGIAINAATRSSPILLSKDLVDPYSHQYGLTLERKFTSGMQLRLGYVGSRTIKLLNNYIFNRATNVPGIPITTETVDARRADPRFYDLRWIVNGGNAYMDAAQATLDIPRWRGLQVSTTYTFGKAIDQGPDYIYTAANKDMASGRAQSQANAFADRKGLSQFDATHAYVLNYTYELPRIAQNFRAASWLLDGWQLTGATTFKSGTPLTLYIGSDAPGFGNVDGGPSDRPNILDPSILGKTISNPDVAPTILRRDRFAFIALGADRGSLGRNTFRKAGIANFNAALTRQWRIPAAGRELGLVFRGEAYNATNHAQFDEPQRNLSSPSFGKITNALNDGRVFQLGLRVII